MAAADSTPIDQILAEVQSKLPADTTFMPPPVVTQTRATMQGNPGYMAGMASLARNIFLYAMVFGCIMVVSLPFFQDMVLSYIPSAVTSAGVLSKSGAWFKAIAGTVLFIILQTVILR
jgi:hypothetical protein